MTNTRFILFIFLFLFSPVLILAQEFNCVVTVNDEELEGTSFDYAKPNLESEIQSYINEYNWTEIEFSEEEKIKCQISIILKTGDQDFSYSAETIISARRPIYNTTSETTSLIISDQTWRFAYPEGKSLIHDDLQFEDITGVIDFYCYLLLGFDFDSFSNLGGTPYFQKAQDVVDLAQNTTTIGWSRSSNNQRNRFVLISDILSNNYEGLRTSNYTYHRLGLDTFTANPIQAREQVITALTLIRDAKRRSTSNFLFDLFFDTKNREIASIFLDADSKVKLEAYNILRETDQGHLTEYEKLQN